MPVFVIKNRIIMRQAKRYLFKLFSNAQGKSLIFIAYFILDVGFAQKVLFDCNSTKLE